MILRALLPAGHMIDPLSGSVVICSDRGLAEIPADEGGAPNSVPDGPCVFALHANAVPPPSPVLLAQMRLPARQDDGAGLPETIVPGRGLAAPPPPAQAPPALI